MTTLRDTETKSSKFKRLAERRTDEIILKLALLGNLANKRNYDYSEKDASKIIRHIKSEVAKLEEAFKGMSERKKFKL